MKLDFSQNILGLTGEVIKTSPNDNSNMTLRDVSIMALLETLPEPGRHEPENLDAKTKVRNATLAMNIQNAVEPLKVSVEDLALLKDRIGRAYQPLVVMRAYQMIENPITEDAE